MAIVPEERRDSGRFASLRAALERRFSATLLGRAVEALRIAMIVGAGIFTMSPFLHDGVLGGGDAKWYSAVTADHVEQWRMGLGPAFVGQTRFAAIGTVMPLRIAPYLQHLAVALDFATGRRLSPYLLLNLSVFLSGVGAGLSAYLCLRSLMGPKRWEALLLALLYLWSPAVMGIAYYGQMYMSVMALPYLPIVFCGIVRVYDRDAFSGWAMVAAGCAACWLSHPPIGLWVTLAGAVAIALRWIQGAGWRLRDVVRSAGAGLLFAGLCGYVFVSVAVLDPWESSHVPKSNLLEVVRAAFPASLNPTSPLASLFSDLQLGWSLWAALLACGTLAWVIRSKPARALSLVGLLLACLCLPVPWVTAHLWNGMPQAVVDATNAVPMQRLYPIMAACAVTLAASVLPWAALRRDWVLKTLLVAAVWSGYEMLPFHHRGSLITNSKQTSELSMSPDNLLMTRFSLGMLSSNNAFYSDSVMDFELEQRVLAADKTAYIVTNVGAVAPGLDFGRFKARPVLQEPINGSNGPEEKIFVNLLPTFTLQPGEHYLLALDVPNDGRRGIIQATGNGFYREFYVPTSGGPFSFGSTPSSSRVFPLSTTSRTPLVVTLTFINQDPDADMSRFESFGHYRLIPYDPKALPLRLVSMVPYVAQVSTPAAGWYESFRYYTPGWTATVNGRPASAQRSMNGLIAVPVGAGQSEVRLLYRPPPALLESYGLAWASWLGMLLVAAWRALRGGFSWAAPARGATVATQ